MAAPAAILNNRVWLAVCLAVACCVAVACITPAFEHAKEETSQSAAALKAQLARMSRENKRLKIKARMAQVSRENARLRSMMSTEETAMAQAKESDPKVVGRMQQAGGSSMDDVNAVFNNWVEKQHFASPPVSVEWKPSVRHLRAHQAELVQSPNAMRAFFGDSQEPRATEATAGQAAAVRTKDSKPQKDTFAEIFSHDASLDEEQEQRVPTVKGGTVSADSATPGAMAAVNAAFYKWISDHDIKTTTVHV